MCKDNRDHAGTGAATEYEYKVDKYVYIVTPVYNEKSGKNIYSSLLSLMKKDLEKHEKS